MEIAIFVVGALALGFGAWVFVLIRAQGKVRDEGAVAKGERDLLAAANARLIEESRRVGGELFEAKAKAEESGERVVKLSVEIAEINERLSGAEKRYLDLVNDEKRLTEQFEAIGGKSLRANQEALSKFLTDRLKDADKLSQAELDKRKQAFEELVNPISETLDATKKQITQLDERVKASGESSESLVKTTAKLARALAKPHVRGAYGEIQLKRVVELSGMRSYCDFSEQDTREDSDGRSQRPDMIVKLPNDRVIVVDAKAPIYAYHEAVNAETPEEREVQLEKFGKDIRKQVSELNSKQYWKNYEHTPDFVVMFVPGDNYIDEALSRHPDLIEFASNKKVIFASPSTLIGLLRAVALGWEEQRLSESARALGKLGEELLERSEIVFEHTASLGKSLSQSIGHYNSVVGSLSSRLVPTLRKFEAHKEVLESDALEAPAEIERQTRELPSDLF